MFSTDIRNAHSSGGPIQLQNNHVRICLREERSVPGEMLNPPPLTVNSRRSFAYCPSVFHPEHQKGTVTERSAKEWEERDFNNLADLLKEIG